MTYKFLSVTYIFFIIFMILLLKKVEKFWYPQVAVPTYNVSDKLLEPVPKLVYFSFGNDFGLQKRGKIIVRIKIHTTVDTNPPKHFIDYSISETYGNFNGISNEPFIKRKNNVLLIISFGSSYVFWN